MIQKGRWMFEPTPIGVGEFTAPSKMRHKMRLEFSPERAIHFLGFSLAKA